MYVAESLQSIWLSGADSIDIFFFGAMTIAPIFEITKGGKNMGSFIKDKISRVDPLMFACTSVLSLVSIIVIFGARNSEFGGTRTIVMQIAMTVFGLLMMILLANVDYGNVPPWFFFLIYGFS